MKEITEITEITLLMTKSCNLNCTYCTQKHTQKHTQNNSFQFQKVKSSLLDTLKKTKNNFSLHFFGGEPTLEYKNIIKVLNFFEKYYKDSKGSKREHLDKKSITFTIYSNGIFNKNIIFEIENAYLNLKEKLSKLNIFITLNFNISHDGLNQSQRDPKEIFTKKIKENIKILNEKKLLKGITFIYKDKLLENYFYLSDLFEIPETKINHSIVREPQWWDEEKINKYIKEFKEFYNYLHNNKSHQVIFLGYHH